MRGFSVLGAWLICMGLAGAAQAEVVVYSPGGLGETMEEVGVAAAKAGVPFTLVVGHSPGQARQVVAGAPADIFISADPKWMDFLADQHLLAAGGAAPLASTHLVLVALSDSALRFDGRPGESLAAALGSGRLAIGDPEMLPSGRLAKMALTKQGSWPGLEGRLAMLNHVRAVVAMVERGEVPAGIGFSSDVINDPKLRVVMDFSTEWMPPVRFPMAVIAGHDSPETAKVSAFLRGPESLAVLRAHGFSGPAD